ncbi:rod-binding protein [Azorhizobium caulinodans]|uniref:Flagellar protein FlgJ N-terminal domain-containing protein n=1 Tax=Azorhizobium caulinodans (strain ATCC 43989 / DSM 5975 / JCM 20966 / LMG 6465 / NBRC 14845 / NCIMB 13405 / ORS 571) TaxID=438753 RepID=A8IPN3_AZOC5|nr:rod-binding protein [Azorhizobium caulinodans]BAF86655.1 hypothetical protein AZC_0657 [Azorhizobium caulinodans ORS 571]
MAIQPPSDIVLDVMQAADPAKAQKVTANLQRLATSASSGVFDTMVQGVAGGFSGGLSFASTSTTSLHNLTNLSKRPGAEPGEAASELMAKAGNDPLRKFEAMVLSTFVESMLPKSTAVYGAGNAGNVWRSMLAQKMGDQVAEAGGIGIAKTIAARHPEMRTVSGAQVAGAPTAAAARLTTVQPSGGEADKDTTTTGTDISI